MRNREGVGVKHTKKKDNKKIRIQSNQNEKTDLQGGLWGGERISFWI